MSKVVENLTGSKFLSWESQINTALRLRCLFAAAELLVERLSCVRCCWEDSWHVGWLLEVELCVGLVVGCGTTVTVLVGALSGLGLYRVELVDGDFR